MKKPRINKHRYGLCIQLAQNTFFDVDINEWHFLPSIEFHRRAGVVHMLVFAFLCFRLEIRRWRFYK